MAKIKQWKQKDVLIYFLPPYSPELNLIEILWRRIKYQWLDFHAYKSFENLKEKLNFVLTNFGINMTLNFNLYLQQIQLPILAKFLVSEKFSLLAGPNLAFDMSENLPSQLKGFGVGLGLGGSLRLAKRISLDARYNIGLSNWFKDPYASVATYKISDLQIGIVYKL